MRLVPPFLKNLPWCTLYDKIGNNREAKSCSVANQGCSISDLTKQNALFGQDYNVSSLLATQKRRSQLTLMLLSLSLPGSEAEAEAEEMEKG